MVAKYDYIALKDEYVQTPGLSIRGLCERHGIRTWSTVNKRKNDEGWDASRAEFERQVENKSLEALATKRANKIAEIQMDALNVIQSGILKMAEDMDAVEEYQVGEVTKTRRVMRIYPRDLAILIDKFQTLIGAPQQINEHRNLGIDLVAEADDDTLKALLGKLRPQRSVGPAEGAVTRADPPSTRTN